MEQDEVNNQFDRIIANTCRWYACDKPVLEHTFIEYIGHRNPAITQEQARALFLQK
jgi:hypothetical protein